jgi:hypothetical protein
VAVLLSLAAHCAMAADPPEGSAAAGDGSTTEQKPGDGFFGRLKDPYDGRLDVTAGSAGGASGFVPLAVPQHDPTLGAGLVAGMVYFHPSKLTEEQAKAVPGNDPPTMTGGGAGYTDNESWAIAGFHSAVWNGGRTRYLGVLGRASVNLEYYGTDADADLSAKPLRFNIEGTLLVQQMLFRLGNSRAFAGLRYQILSGNVAFDIVPDHPLALGVANDAGLSGVLDYDTRDNTFTPNEGTKFGLMLAHFDKSLGGDFTYSKLSAKYLRYWQLREQRLTFGLRLDYDFAGDEAPFYSLPWVSLRGIPLMRYLGNHVITAEVEPRWKIDERWSVVGFGGVGRAASKLDKLHDAEPAYNYGGGFRYLLSRKLGLAGGVDIARGPEDTVIYLTFGSAWGM